MSIANALVGPLSLHDPDPPGAKRISVDNAVESTWGGWLDTSDKEQLLVDVLPPPRSRFDWTLTSKIVLVLVLAISYLTFCFIAHYHAIPIGGSGVLGPRFVHFTSEAGITTIAILIIYIALWPIHGLIAEIRSEEFFRFLCTHPNGVPLDSVNAVSTPTTGPFDIFWATLHSRCSYHLTATVVTTLLIAATSALAPAALNTASIPIDVGDPAFQVGAILNSSIISRDWGFGLRLYQSPQYDLYPLASSLSWVENVLNVTTSYSRVASSEDDLFRYIVPCPPGYTSTTQAYWTTDIIILNPSCDWQNATSTGVVDVKSNSTTDQDWTAALPEANLSLTFLNDPFVSTGANAQGSVAVTDSDNGSSVFVISEVALPPFPSSTDFSNIPTLQLSNGNTLAFLLCNPRASIQTRQVRSTGNGTLTLGQPQQRQGNLDLDQVNVLLGSVLSQLATSSGPFKISVGMSDMMIRLIFGDSFQEARNTAPAPLTDITMVYTQVIQSAMKTFLSGAINTTIVPGGLVKEQLVFTSSLGHVIVSAVLFALLTTALVVAQFRTRQDAFTLINVAAALTDSDVPQKSVEKKQLAGVREKKILRLVLNDRGGLNFIYQSLD